MFVFARGNDLDAPNRSYLAAVVTRGVKVNIGTSESTRSAAAAPVSRETVCGCHASAAVRLFAADTSPFVPSAPTADAVVNAAVPSLDHTAHPIGSAGGVIALKVSVKRVVGFSRASRDSNDR